MLSVLKDLDLLADASFKLSFNLKDIGELDAQFIPKLNKNLIEVAELINTYSRNTLTQIADPANTIAGKKADELEYSINELLSKLKNQLNKKKHLTLSLIHI